VGVKNEIKECFESDRKYAIIVHFRGKCSWDFDAKEINLTIHFEIN